MKVDDIQCAHMGPRTVHLFEGDGQLSVKTDCPVLQESVQISEMLISEEMKTCSADDLFNYIVRNVVSFASSIGRSDHQAFSKEGHVIWRDLLDFSTF